MKKLSFILIAIMAMTLIFSCSNKKATSDTSNKPSEPDSNFVDPDPPPPPSGGDPQLNHAKEVWRQYDAKWKNNELSFNDNLRAHMRTYLDLIDTDEKNEYFYGKVIITTKEFKDGDYMLFDMSESHCPPTGHDWELLERALCFAVEQQCHNEGIHYVGPSDHMETQERDDPYDPFNKWKSWASLHRVGVSKTNPLLKRAVLDSAVLDTIVIEIETPYGFFGTAP